MVAAAAGQIAGPIRLSRWIWNSPIVVGHNDCRLQQRSLHILSNTIVVFYNHCASKERAQLRPDGRSERGLNNPLQLSAMRQNNRRCHSSPLPPLVGRLSRAERVLALGGRADLIGARVPIPATATEAFGREGPLIDLTPNSPLPAAIGDPATAPRAKDAERIRDSDPQSMLIAANKDLIPRPIPTRLPAGASFPAQAPRPQRNREMPAKRNRIL